MRELILKVCVPVGEKIGQVQWDFEQELNRRGATLETVSSTEVTHRIARRLWAKYVAKKMSDPRYTMQEFIVDEDIENEYEEQWILITSDLWEMDIELRNELETMVEVGE